MIRTVTALALLALSTQALAADPAPAPGEIVAAAPKAEWVAIAPSDLLVMDLAPDAKAHPRRVVIQLMPPPFSQGWIGNIRKLAAAHWWDGLSINRVQDNYVVQWGDASEKKALPTALAGFPNADYVLSGPDAFRLGIFDQMAAAKKLRRTIVAIRAREATEKTAAPVFMAPGVPAIYASRDPYSEAQGHFRGWPLAVGGQSPGSVWPVHCYGMVGVGRNLPPDTGNGAELYTVIGHAPRHLDRNIALVGRVIEGIEHLSSLPRGTGALGFYQTPEERTKILSVRLLSAMEVDPVPRYEYLSTESATFARYADARANRRDPFFIVPAGGADICNIPVPVRRVKR